MRRLAAIFFWLALICSAHAQSVIQSGNVTPTHFSCFITNGVIGDCGVAAAPYASTGGVQPGPWCVNSGPQTGPYQSFCLNANTTTGGILSIQNFGGAPAGGIGFLVNGVAAGLPVVTTPTVSGDLAVFNNTVGGITDSGILSSDVARIGANLTWTGNHTFAPTSGNAITITPAANSISQALNVTQTSPSSGSATGPLSYDYLSITHRVNVTTAGLTRGLPNNDVAGFRVDMFMGGGSVTGDSSFAGIFTANNVNSGGTVNAIRGLVGFMYSTQPSNGGHGVDGVALIDNGGSVSSQFGGMEASAGICDGLGTDIWCSSLGAGGSANRRYAISLIGIGRTTGTTTDTAIIVANNGTAGAAWNKLVTLSNYGGQAPLSTGADFFYSETPYTVANIFNLSNITVTGNILNFPNVTLSGAGVMNVAAGGAYNIAGDTFLNRRGAAIWQFGNVDAASPVAQSLAMQNVVTGTSNTAGVDFVIGASRGTGTGVGGSIILKVAPAGSTGSTVNSLVQKFTLLGSGNLGIGTETNPQSQFVVSQNTTTAQPISGSTLATIAADAAQNIIYQVTYGNASGNAFVFHSAEGTGASPTQTAVNDVLGSFQFAGYNQAGTTFTAGRARVAGIASNNFDGSNQGAFIEFDVTPAGSITRAQAMRAMAGVIIGTGTTDPGAGVLNVQGGYQANGTAGVSTVCTETVGNTLTFTFGLLTTKGVNCT